MNADATRLRTVPVSEMSSMAVLAWVMPAAPFRLALPDRVDTKKPRPKGTGSPAVPPFFPGPETGTLGAL